MTDAEKIEEIRRRVDLVALVGQDVELRKRGERYVGLCPFHQEKTPSFSVLPKKGFFYCFGCHAGGDAFSYVMRHQGLEFPEACRRLAAHTGVVLEPESAEEIERRQEAERVVRANELALEYFCGCLMNHRDVPAVRNYVQERGLSVADMKHWKIGLGGSGLVRFLEHAGISKTVAEEAGLLREGDGRSLFDGRLTFPIYDSVGRLVGFGGRRLGGGATPKYVNSRESRLFSKRRLLFGWEHAQDAMRRSRRVVIVEGYFDVIACHRAGCTETVAALGTALTAEHAKSCARLVQEIVLLLDADAAGRRATQEATKILLANGLRTLVAVLPRGEDPDTWVAREGAQSLRQAIDAARPALDVLMDWGFEHAGDDIQRRVGAVQELAPLLSSLQSGLERDLYTAKLASELGMPVEQLKGHLQSAAKSTRRQRPPEAEPPRAVPSLVSDMAPDRMSEAAQMPPPEPVWDAVELTMLRELLLYPSLRERFSELAEYSASDTMQRLWEGLAVVDASIGDVLAEHRLDTGWQRRLLGVAPIADHEEGPERALKTFADILLRMKVRHLETALRDVVSELGAAESRGEDVQHLLIRKRDLTRKKLELRRRGLS